MDNSITVSDEGFISSNMQMVISNEAILFKTEAKLRSLWIPENCI